MTDQQPEEIEAPEYHDDEPDSEGLTVDDIQQLLDGQPVDDPEDN